LSADSSGMMPRPGLLGNGIRPSTMGSSLALSSQTFLFLNHCKFRNIGWKFIHVDMNDSRVSL